MIKTVISFSIALLLSLSLVNAGSVGIIPASFKTYFEPNLEESFDFRIVTADQEKRIDFYANGDLAQYVTLDKNYTIGNGNLNVRLNLPPNIEVPGNHRILIGAIESNQSPEGGGSMFGGFAAIQAPIDVFVPYPGKYLKAEFDIININKGENALFNLKVHNLGTENLNVYSTLDIYSSEGELKTSEELNFGLIKSKDLAEKRGVINSSNFSRGNYRAVVRINYGEILELKKEFKIGDFFVNISDYSYIFESGKINRFNIEIENLWNSKMGDVYAEVTITDSGEVLDLFQTPSADLEPWEKRNLTGFLDATNISEGKYTASIRLFYGDKTDSKLVAVYLENPPEKDYLFRVLLYAAGFLIFICLAIIAYLIIKIKIIKGEHKIGSKKNKNKKS